MNGVCRYCGSLVMTEAETQEEADRIASEMCSCDAAQLKQKLTRRIERIEELTEDFEDIRPQERELLKLICGAAEHDLYKSATVTLQSGVKAKITVSAEGIPKLTLSQTNQQICVF